MQTTIRSTQHGSHRFGLGWLTAACVAAAMGCGGQMDVESDDLEREAESFEGAILHANWEEVSGPAATGWRMIAPALEPGKTLAATSAFSPRGRIVSEFKEWNTATGKWQKATRLVGGRGYLVQTKVGPTKQVASSANRPATGPATITVAAGWNLIGNPYAHEFDWSRHVALSGTSVVEGPFVMGPSGGYEPAMQIRKFAGIWVKFSTAGTVTFNAGDGVVKWRLLHDSEVPGCNPGAPGNCRGRSGTAALKSAVAVGTDGTIYGIQDSDRYWTTTNDGVQVDLRTPGYLLAVTPAGAIRWQAPCNAGDAGAPLVTPMGDIVVGCGSELKAFRPDGSLHWSYTGDNNLGEFDTVTPALDSTGTIWMSHNAFFGGTARVTTHDPNTGAQLAETRFGSGGFGVIVHSASVGPDGTVYVGVFGLSNSSGLYLFPKSGASFRVPFHRVGNSPSFGADGTIYVNIGKLVNRQWENALYAIQPGSCSTAGCTVKWTVDIHSDSATVAVGADGTLYANTTSLMAIAPNGTIKWEFDLAHATRSGRVGAGVPTLGEDGTIYAATRQFGWDAPHDLLAFNRNGQLLWQSDIGPFANNPAIGRDGTLYVGSTALFGSTTLAANAPWAKYQANNTNSGRR